MKVVFRVDASNVIGTGHVIRCLTLADALRARGADCGFVCRTHEGNLIGKIESRGYDVSRLAIATVDSLSGQEIGYARWLGSSWQADVEETANVMCEVPDWLIVDHYGLDWKWEASMHKNCERLMVIDDLANRSHECDLILDQNWLGTEGVRRYDSLIPMGCTKLLGPQYALLRPEYGTLRALMPRRDGSVRRVLVFLGGSDQTNETGKVLSALAHQEFSSLAVDVVLGLNHPCPDVIVEMAAARPGTTVHRNLLSLAGLMARSDLMIGSGGTTTWERMSLGLPSIVITVAENQRLINEVLMRDGLIEHLGASVVVQVTDIVGALGRALAVPERLCAQSAAMQELVSAAGAEEVVLRLSCEENTDDASTA
jgi:UDP-2,4-diacetamido-2,4,6-trideoxy-beta-L-altropyranose hydrolase